MRFSFIVIVVLLVLSACGPSDQYKISRDEFDVAIRDSSALLVDVRTPEEFETARIPGAVNYDIKSDDFEAQVEDLERSTPMYLYCRSGGRSDRAAQKLKELGFENVFDLEGGILGWTEEGLPADSTSLEVAD